MTQQELVLRTGKQLHVSNHAKEHQEHHEELNRKEQGVTILELGITA